MREKIPGRRACAWLVAWVLGLAPVPAALGGDPLDDLDGTESWDQVAPPTTKTKPTQRQENDLRREVADWESIRQQWEMAREEFLIDRARHKQLSASMGKTAPGAVINDSNVNQLKKEDDWGDGSGEQWIQPGGNLDRVIESEIQESTPAAVPHAPIVPPVASPAVQAVPEQAEAQPEPPPPPPPVAPTAITPPDMGTGSTVPSAFKQPVSDQPAEAGLAPGPAQPSPARSNETPKSQVKDADDEGARAAAEMLKQQEAMEKRKEAEAEAKRKAEADAGAAAAAKLLKMQAEKERLEAEALRKKMNVNVDEEGQVVDPELQREMDEE